MGNKKISYTTNGRVYKSDEIAEEKKSIWEEYEYLVK